MNSPAVICVTGASRGLGRGIAQALAKDGFSVAINYAGNAGAAAETAENCRGAAPNEQQQFVPIQGDISDRASRRGILDQTLEAFGRVDALVNNAGIAPEVRADITEATEESFDQLISTNLKGPYFLTQIFANHWLGKPYDSRIAQGFQIVNVSSVSSHTASTSRGEYCISKAGLSMATQLWAYRLAGEGIQVIELRPGIMKTDMTSAVTAKYDALIADGLVPQGRWGSPTDLGLAVSAIMTGHFPFSTGTVIDIDGGFQIRRL